jgi:hypothetical protein
MHCDSLPVAHTGSSQHGCSGCSPPFLLGSPPEAYKPTLYPVRLTYGRRNRAGGACLGEASVAIMRSWPGCRVCACNGGCQETAVQIFDHERLL